ncbi:hypothetical protein [Salinisphaera sp. S4-8]
MRWPLLRIGLKYGWRLLKIAGLKKNFIVVVFMDRVCAIDA